mmetsp:Transcript_15701/g.36835  ORF Transcript_15701/g.36835 Transcript_15701/m.36835 type:complete len:385 (-) Transcript_15701:38-1192(-)
MAAGLEADEQRRVSNAIMSIFQSPTWIVPTSQFVDENCGNFEDIEENKLEYTDVHNAFKQLIDHLLAVHLTELQIPTERFLLFCQQGLDSNDALHRNLVEQLISADDFLIFKAMMVKRNAELTKELLSQDAALPSMSEEGQRLAEQIEREQLEVERLEAQQKFLEAELRLAIALSMRLEQRLKMLEALNAMIETVNQVTAHELQAQRSGQGQADGDASAVPDMVRPQPLAPQEELPSGFWMTDSERAALERQRNPAPPSEQTTGGRVPTEEERQARAEHLKRQRELLLDKKKREREGQLSSLSAQAAQSNAAKAAERACAITSRSGDNPRAMSEAGQRLAAELSGLAPEPSPMVPNPESTAVEMRKALAKQLKQTLTQSSLSGC